MAENEIAIVADVSPEMLIAKAIEHGMSVDTLERLLAMRETLRLEAARAAFFAALAAFQGECPIIGKDQEANTGKYKYRYAPLDTIVRVVAPLLAKHGFSYTFQCRTEDNAQIAICTAHHCGGHSQSSEFRVPIDRNAVMNEPQKHASALTYGKRYAFCGVFGISTGDEDNDAASVETKSRDKFMRLKPLIDPEPQQPSAQDARVDAYQASRIGDGQRRSLEQQIRELAEAFGQGEELREKIKQACANEFGVEHFKDLTPEQYTTVIGWINAKWRTKGISA